MDRRQKGRDLGLSPALPVYARFPIHVMRQVNGARGTRTPTYQPSGPRIRTMISEVPRGIQRMAATEGAQRASHTGSLEPVPCILRP